MRYDKLPLTFPEQADLLLSRGLAGNRELIISRLRAVSYYRLSAYWHPFKNPDGSLKPNTSIEMVWRRYVFDRRLRMLVMDAIERIEVALRTDVVYRHTHKYDPFAYSDPRTLPHLTPAQHDEFLRRIDRETRRSKEVFVAHFKEKYGDKHERLPLWMAAEIATFGGLLTLFRGLETGIKKEIARQYKLNDRILRSWLRSLNGTRNICAHHGRLWNRELGYKPMIPRERKHPEWHRPVAVKNNRIFGILTILRYMLVRIAPQSNWQGRLEELLIEYSDIPLIPMGFPKNWQESPIWNNSTRYKEKRGRT